MQCKYDVIKMDKEDYAHLNKDDLDDLSKL